MARQFCSFCTDAIGAYSRPRSISPDEDLDWALRIELIWASLRQDGRD